MEEIIQKHLQKIQNLEDEISKKIIGQKKLVQRLIEALISNGHVLLEGLPGLAKTTAIKTLGLATNLGFSRIQFTPDLLPADLVGTQIFDMKESVFKTKKGPVFSNLVLADEINRAPAKVQSALLQAMEERQVTIGERTFNLDPVFLVLATQNPLEQEGTYPLPEAQLDRFLFKLKIGYPTKEEEALIMKTRVFDQPVSINPVVSDSDILAIRETCSKVHVDDKIRKYIVDIVFASRDPSSYSLSRLKNYILCGASPRSSIYLEQTSKVHALLQGRSFVIPQDIKDIGLDILRHRIILSYEAQADNVSQDECISEIFDGVDVP